MHPSVRLVLTALSKWSSQEDRCRAARLILFTVGRQRRGWTDGRALFWHMRYPKRTCHYRCVTQENNHLTPCRVFTVASEPLATQTKSIWSSSRDRVVGMSGGGGLHPGLGQDWQLNLQRCLEGGNARSTGGFIYSRSPQNKKGSAGTTATFGRDTLTGSVWKHADTVGEVHSSPL